MSITIRNFYLSILCGILFGAAWPIKGVTILIFLALVPLLYIENSISQDNSKRKGARVFGYSYISFLLWNLITTWWLYNASFYGMLFAITCNSLFYATIFLFYHLAKRRLPIKSANILLVSLWLSFEKLHLFWDFSWTWLNLGNVFSEKIYWIQWYEYTGVFGGSLWVLIMNIWIFNILKKDHFKFSKKSLKIMFGPLFLLSIPVLVSLIIYQNLDDPKRDIEVVIFQPNIDPYDKKYNTTNKKFFKDFIEKSTPYITEKTNYILTPETYFAEGYGEKLSNFSSSELHQSIQGLLKNYPNLELITGIQFYNTYFQKEAPSYTANLVRDNLWIEFYNSALSEKLEKKPSVYHKSKLVVGVENMPFKSILKPLLGNVLIDLGGTVSSRVVQNDRLVFSHHSKSEKAAPIICYESIFGEFVTDYVKKGASFFAIISNDAWWGETPGHRQLLSYTRLRAIENRRDIVRSANTGISAIINSKGEIIKKTDYNVKTVLKGNFASNSEITFYSKYGDYIARLAILMTLILSLLSISGRLKKQ